MYNKFPTGDEDELPIVIDKEELHTRSIIDLKSIRQHFFVSSIRDFDSFLGDNMKIYLRLGKSHRTHVTIPLQSYYYMSIEAMQARPHHQIKQHRMTANIDGIGICLLTLDLGFEAIPLLVEEGGNMKFPNLRLLPYSYGIYALESSYKIIQPLPWVCLLILLYIIIFYHILLYYVD